MEVKVLEVHGQLIFEEGGERNLTASHIYISYLGSLTIGTPEKPFPHKAVIALKGHRRYPGWPVRELMSKFIASSGKVDLFGASLPTWTRLAKAVAKGGAELQLETDLKLKKGDELLVTTTSVDRNAYDKSVVKSVSGTTVTLSKPLEHAHDGLDTVHDGHAVTKGMMAGEVAVTRGSIVIEGLDTPGFQGKSSINDEKFGAVINVFPVSDKCGAAPPLFRMQGVEMRYCGRDTTHCVGVEGADKRSFVKNSVVHDGLGDGFIGGFAGIQAGILIMGNLVYDFPKGHGIGGEARITDNLVTKCGYGYRTIDGKQNFKAM
jgi:hypothetical protein